ncbi:putative reverse transcriptase domain-containing protein [Tanacetum coccineum]
MMCTKMVPEEEDQVEKFIGERREQEEIVQTTIEANRWAQPPSKLQILRLNCCWRAYTAGNNEKNGYGGTLPFCNKCKLHQEGQCNAKFHNCKRIGHLARDCRSVVTVSTQGTTGPNQGVITCFECGAQGHYRKDYPKVKNQNQVFPEDLPGLPPIRQVEFQIDLVLVLSPVSSSPVKFLGTRDRRGEEAFTLILRRLSQSDGNHPRPPDRNSSISRSCWLLAEIYRRFLQDCQAYDEADSEKCKVQLG